MTTYKQTTEILSLFKPTDTLAVPLATGQPLSLMNLLSEKKDWQRLEIFSGLFTFPFEILSHEKVHVKSGYYGPIERFLNESGKNISYLPANFNGFEIYAHKTKPRVVAVTLSPPDKDGFLTFGTHSGAAYNTFIEAINDKNRVAIAEINPTMPIVYGDQASGDNKIHASKIEHIFLAENSQMELPAIEATDTEIKIAENVLSLIGSGDTLQFGIGGVPDTVATKLALSNLANFGIHSELISDGFLKMFEAGKISNHRKKNYAGQSVFTFAFGTKALYDFLDERNGKNKRQAICLPVNLVNDPFYIAQNPNMVSINSGLMIDFAGQVSSEAIGLKQYSGVGGQLSFVEGAYRSENGRSVICLKSTATVGDKLISNIYPTLPAGSVVSTPRHFVQYIVTEFGVANLYGLSDEERGPKLIEIAHPKFRDELSAAYEKMRAQYYLKI